MCFLVFANVLTHASACVNAQESYDTDHQYHESGGQVKGRAHGRTLQLDCQGNSHDSGDGDNQPREAFGTADAKGTSTQHVGVCSAAPAASLFGSIHTLLNNTYYDKHLFLPKMLSSMICCCMYPPFFSHPEPTSPHTHTLPPTNGDVSRMDGKEFGFENIEGVF